MSLQLSKLIAEYGDDKVQFQNLDHCAIDLKYSAKSGTKITFGTEQPVTLDGLDKLGLVVWMDRKRAAEIIAASRATSPTAQSELICPKCGSHSITVVSGMGLRATCGQCGNIGGVHEFRATSPTGA